MIALVCPYCGGTLNVTMETVGPPYLTYEQPAFIECDAGDCEAEWTPNGEVVAGPKWERYPDVYQKPARAVAEKFMRSFEPTEAQIEAAARAVLAVDDQAWAPKPIPDWDELTVEDRYYYWMLVGAALLAAKEADHE